MVTEYAIWPGQFEIRSRDGQDYLTGEFPYDTMATVRSRGRTRKERFRDYSLSWQVREFEKLQAELGDLLQELADEVITNRPAAEARLAALEDGLEKRNTFLLVGHDYNRAIADMRSGSLAVKHTREKVELEAQLPPEKKRPSWVQDAALAVEGGQLRGISPGFVVTSKGGEKLIPEPGNPSVMVREITDAVAYEYSLVARPAYPQTSASVDRRNLSTSSTSPRRRRFRLWL